MIRALQRQGWVLGLAVLFGRLVAILPASAGEEALMRAAYGLQGAPA